MNQEHATIMIVDDTPVNLALLQEILQSQGYRVLVFTRGSMALKAAEKNPPDLILLDITMPEMDGFEVCHKLKSDEILKDIPVLFISALTAASDKVKAFQEGGVDYITKPFYFEEIRARVETHLRLRQMQKDIERQNHHLEDLVKEKILEILNSQIATIHALSVLTESRDDTTGWHIERTSLFCKILSEYLRDKSSYSKHLDGQMVDNIFRSAPLHDIGKVGIPDNILLKPGKLTPEEFDIMKSHVTLGAKTLHTVLEEYPQNKFIATGIEITRSHHEKWNGKGYPDGLTGVAIPLSARIMAVADVYDSLRSERPYKAPFTHEKSYDMIMEGAESDFDPIITEAFKECAKEFADIHASYKTK
jgi:putative two-component system response regulator